LAVRVCGRTHWVRQKSRSDFWTTRTRRSGAKRRTSGRPRPRAIPPSPPFIFEPFQGLAFCPPGYWQNYWQNSGTPGDGARFGERCPAGSSERKGARVLSVEPPWHFELPEYQPPSPLQSRPHTCAALLRHCGHVALRPKVGSSRALTPK
jgi:hypothetical protein